MSFEQQLEEQGPGEILQDGKKDSQKGNRILREIWEAVKVFCLALVIYFLISHFLVQMNIVKGISMFPTLQDRDRIVVSRLVETLRQAPERGDIVTVRGKDIRWKESLQFGDLKMDVDRVMQEDIIKRVIALPGETLRIEDGKVYINGQLFEENYLAPYVETFPLLPEKTEFTLGEDEYFIMGDNRDHSEDSRRFGPVKRDAIMGILLVRVYPFDRISTLR